MRPQISIIIRAFNEEKHIGRLLAGIQEQDFPSENIEVILVDSGSTDATVNIAEHYGVRVISIQPEDFSFGYALNVGCEAAQGEYLLFASAHVYPTYRDWLSEMTQPFENEKVALVYGKQRGNERTKYSEQQIFKKWFPNESDFHQDTPFCNNANAAIPKRLWEESPYDESLTGLEDLAWAKHALAQGYTIVYNAQAEIIHVHEESPKRVLNRYRREAIALKKIMPEAKFSLLDFLRLFIGNSLSDYYHAAQERVLWKNLGAIITFRLMQFWGTFQGYRQSKPLDKSLKNRFYYPNRLKRQMKGSSSRKKIDYAKIHSKEIKY